MQPLQDEETLGPTSIRWERQYRRPWAHCAGPYGGRRGGPGIRLLTVKPQSAIASPSLISTRDGGGLRYWPTIDGDFDLVEDPALSAAVRLRRPLATFGQHGTPWSATSAPGAGLSTYRTDKKGHSGEKAHARLSGCWLLAHRQAYLTSAEQPLPSSPSPARRLREPARRRRSPTTAMRHAARHGWTLSRRRNLAQTQTDTEGEAGLARSEHEEEVSVTTEARKAGSDRGGRSGQDGRRGLNQGKEEGPKRGSSRLDSATNEDMKTGTGRGGWLGQGGRHGHFQVHEEGPKRGSSRLADRVTDMGSKAGLIQEVIAVRTSDFDGEVGIDPGLAIEVGREVGSTMGTAEAGGRQVTVLDTRQAGIRAPFPSSPSPSPPPFPLSLLSPFPPPPSSALPQRGHPAATDPCCPRAARAR